MQLRRFFNLLYLLCNQLMRMDDTNSNSVCLLVAAANGSGCAAQR